VPNSLAQRSVKATGIVLCLAVTLAFAWSGYQRWTGNFHTVEEGVLYRSGQLNQIQFENHIHEKQIRAVLNLRGRHPGTGWYDNEVKVTRAAGIQHFDYPISAKRELTSGQVNEIIVLLRDLPRPVLVHCEAGADRSGLVSAIYKLVLGKQSANEAAQQLSFRYGHFPWLGSRTIAMDRTLEKIASGGFDRQTTE
jgi:protein tyrosine/serine phosphatase